MERILHLLKIASRSARANRSLLVVLAVLLLALPLFMPTAYHRQLLNQVVIFCILAMGYDLIVGYTGQLSLGHIGIFAVGAYSSAILTTKLGLPFPVGFVAAAVVAGLVGAAIGIPALRIKGHYLAVVTLGINEIIRLLLTNLKPITGGTEGISEILPPSLGPLVLASSASQYYFILAIAVLAGIGIWRLDRSRFGRAFKAVRDAELAADVSGINIAHIKILAFVISAVYAGVSGSLYAHTLGFISPEFFGLGLTITLLAMVLVGGRGSLGGAVLGAALLTILPEWLRFMKEYYMVVFGLGVWMITLFLPGGLTSLWSKLRGADPPPESANVEAGSA